MKIPAVLVKIKRRKQNFQTKQKKSFFFVRTTGNDKMEKT
jgi:hypothetical protein